MKSLGLCRDEVERINTKTVLTQLQASNSQMSSLRSNPRPSNSARVGDARRGTATVPIPASNAFALLADSDEEAPVPTTAAEMLSVLSSGSCAWGDVLVSESEIAERVAATRWYPCEDGVVAFDPAVAARAAAARAAVIADEAQADDDRQGRDLFAQPFASNLDWSFADIHNTTRLTDAEYVACMTWLYDQGWEIVSETRAGFDGWPAGLPPRVWVPPASVTPTRQWTQGAARAPRPVTGRAAPVPRFCRDSHGGVPCADPACRYVHADTIACVDKCCGFDGRCSGDKRLTCIYMHPSEGQTWSAGMVVHRLATAPAPAPAPAPEAKSVIFVPAGADDNWIYMLGDGAAGNGYYLSGALRGDHLYTLGDGANGHGFYLTEIPAC